MPVAARADSDRCPAIQGQNEFRNRHRASLRFEMQQGLDLEIRHQRILGKIRNFRDEAATITGRQPQVLVALADQWFELAREAIGASEQLLYIRGVTGGRLGCDGVNRVLGPGPAGYVGHSGAKLPLLVRNDD